MLWTLALIFHWIWHLSRRTMMLNPLRGNCLVDEDLVGDVKTLVQSSTHGTKAHHIPTSVMERYCSGLHFNHMYGSEYKP
eukprot:NODE_22368_length_711_cov_5.128425.p4 GENE.NODE_22368_length_711_cov_5.128425~~NODE_22368_length_711_cov_5.128425.p4  ORF type:complete len:80 (-),score=5.36 NODE_22368_length_711_cov_5.128425:190-429(-)